MRSIIYLVVLLLISTSTLLSKVNSVVSISSLEKPQDDVIRFDYDKTGNRILKEIILQKTRTAEPDIEPSPFVDNTFMNEVIIYPNPTKGQLMVEISDLDIISEGELSILNLRGQIVLKEKIDQNIINLDLTKEMSGTYILQIRINRKISTWKIIKQ